ncbi:MAG: cobyric acid synthase, partial [Victivallales bacterium]|nr:cobyric acid synthase [Victivallales bacterium]
EEADNDRLAAALATIGGGSGATTFHLPSPRRTPALMLQGTSSDAGKSILTAALGRIMLQDGYDVAPFKAQNMSLNSYVTPDGGEIGRAQALQAEACRLDPEVRMNPILLKPASDTGSQVVVLGRPEGNLRVREYYAAKQRLFERVNQAYDTLAAEHEVMLLEGAGSPGEINLKATDIVNMNMARHAAAPVLLVGDIDRGGVYASFLGMYETFERWERQWLRGFLVNKFRGDTSLLAPAHDYLLERTGKPVLGVVPFLPELRLPAEDSLSFDLIPTGKKDADALDTALIVVGHLANFTDFAPLELEPDVQIRHVRRAADLGTPDLIILPGSKNVVADMASLWQSRLAEAIIAQVKEGAWLVGICGGLQFSGEEIRDPRGVEAAAGENIRALGLLPLITELGAEKQLRQTRGIWTAKNLPVEGYEIHHGITSCRKPELIAIPGDHGYPLGFAAGRVWTTYLHGVFDRDRFRREFIDLIRVDRGRPPRGAIQATYELEPELNRLADHVRRHVDMAAIYRLMGLS